MRYMVLLAIVLVQKESAGFPYFRERIPNGDRVPNPCDPQEIWKGVGHQHLDGGDDRNPFGADFVRAGKTWTREFCEMDSDADGITNGEELGDPDCMWTPGNTPATTMQLSHPGICEPLDSDTCRGKNDWLDCSSTGNNNCPAFKEPGVKNVTLRFPRTKVPSHVTNYFCQIFDLPDGDFHLVGSRPIIDNLELTHHILLFGCDEREEEIPVTPHAFPCGMVAHPKCINIIGTWTVGSSGDCLHVNTGFRIGTRGFRRAAMQVHWNNQRRQEGQTDSSGLVVYYTANRRTYDAAMFAVGQEFIEIPPRQPEVNFHSSCSGDCTAAMFPTPIYITRAVNHMHYMGIKQRITLHRNSTKIRDITFDNPYSYDSPAFYKYDPPIEVLPGDEIRTTCTYSSIDKKHTVYFGDGTSDEMCFGFMTYYPRQNIPMPYCTTWKSVEKCKRYLPQFGGVVNECPWRKFLSSKNPDTRRIVGNVMSLCSNRSHDNECSDRCTETVEESREHVCLKGDLGELLMYKIKIKFPEVVNYLSQCRRIDETNGSKQLIYLSSIYMLSLLVSCHLLVCL
ncbi:dopamine beta-hydroxylase-like [Argopecten irradians]|uniref:dopamine beta-hydroxylase-like n=1 Tax=Argopecten irradians TaxID=31199 RepID=UPI003712DDE5